MTLAPIALFTYNRPWHTEKVLEALMLNNLADKSNLYIFCDGPKKDVTTEELKKIDEVRLVVRKKNWCKKVQIIEKNDNIGLSQSVINGVSEIVKKHGKIVVLEDDIVTSKHFLQYMNDGLEMYKNEEKVYGVSGYSFPSSKKINKKTFFLPIMSSWGYGTWIDKWSKINFNGSELLNIVEKSGFNNQINFGRLNYYQMLLDQVSGKIDSWAVRFYVSMFLDKGVFLYPNTSLLQNIGLDGSGVHSKKGDSKIYNDSFQRNVSIKVVEKDVRLNPKIIESIKSGGLNMQDEWKKKTKNRLKKIVAPELIQLVKRKSKFYKNKEEQKFINLPRYIKSEVKLLGKNITVPDNASYLFMRKEIFDDHIYKFQTSKKDPYIIDAGANIGLATIYLKLLYPSSKIVAFEPDSNIFKILENNIKVFNLKGVDLIKKGLWNEDTTLTFQPEGADGGLIQDLDKGTSSSENIEVVSLKPYLNQTVNFLKLDIEGAETKVLKDIEPKLSNVDKIFVEYHSFVGQPQTLNIVVDILTKAKFRLYMSIPGDNSIKSPLMGLRNYNNMDFQLNIFGFKEDKN